MDGAGMIGSASLLQWVSTVGSLAALAIAAFAILRSARKDETDLLHGRINMSKEKLDDHAVRLARVEVALDHLPTKEMVGKLETTMAYVRGQGDTINAKFDGFSDRITRIETAVEQLVENELRGPRS